MNSSAEPTVTRLRVPLVASSCQMSDEPVRTSTIVAQGQNQRNNPLIGRVGEWAASVVTLVNEGYIDYNSLQVSGTKRSSRGWTGRLSYAFSRGRGNTATGQGDVEVTVESEDWSVGRSPPPSATIPAPGAY